MASVLHNKYYPVGNVLNSSLASSHLYIWHSLFWGKELLEKGLSWRIGNRHSVDPLEHNWIPREIRFKPTLSLSHPSLGLVDEFTLEDRTWDLSLLREHFLLDDV